MEDAVGKVVFCGWQASEDGIYRFVKSVTATEIDYGLMNEQGAIISDSTVARPQHDEAFIGRPLLTICTRIEPVLDIAGNPLSTFAHAH